MTTAVLIGATGLVGSHLLDRLAGDDRFTAVRVIARQELAAPSKKVSVTVCDFDDLARHADDFACDAFFSALGTTIARAKTPAKFARVDRDYVTQAARLAKEAGARHALVVSSVGASLQSRSLYLRTKGEMEAAVTGLGFDALDIFRPGVLRGARREFRLAERVAEALLMTVGPFLAAGLARYRAITAQTVAAAMVAAAARPDPGRRVHHNREIEDLARAG